MEVNKEDKEPGSTTESSRMVVDLEFDSDSSRMVRIYAIEVRVD